MNQNRLTIDNYTLSLLETNLLNYFQHNKRRVYYTANNDVLSVTMMFMYIGIFKPVHVEKNVCDFTHNFDSTAWIIKKERENNTIISEEIVARKIINDIDNPEYSEHAIKIKNADMNYPIILCENNIIDGLHRLCRAVELGNEKINAYEFDKELLAKFKIGNNNSKYNFENTTSLQLVNIFIKRFLQCSFYKL